MLAENPENRFRKIRGYQANAQSRRKIARHHAMADEAHDGQMF